MPAYATRETGLGDPGDRPVEGTPIRAEAVDGRLAPPPVRIHHRLENGMTLC